MVGDYTPLCPVYPSITMTKRLSFEDESKDDRPGLIKVSTSVCTSDVLLLSSSLGFMLDINVASSDRVLNLPSKQPTRYEYSCTAAQSTACKKGFRARSL